jgi:hypothetical protein
MPRGKRKATQKQKQKQHQSVNIHIGNKGRSRRGYGQSQPRTIVINTTSNHSNPYGYSVPFEFFNHASNSTSKPSLAESMNIKPEPVYRLNQHPRSLKDILEKEEYPRASVDNFPSAVPDLEEGSVGLSHEHTPINSIPNWQPTSALDTHGADSIRTHDLQFGVGVSPEHAPIDLTPWQPTSLGSHIGERRTTDLNFGVGVSPPEDYPSGYTRTEASIPQPKQAEVLKGEFMQVSRNKGKFTSSKKPPVPVMKDPFHKL